MSAAIRRLLGLLAAAVALGIAAFATAAPTDPPPVFVLEGGGWGHGVGMSQWGAYGQAKAGRDYKTILTTYYTGVAFGKAPTPLLRRLRLLVADRQSTVAITSTKRFTVTDAAGRRVAVPPGTLELGPDLQVPDPAGRAPLALKGPLVVSPSSAGILGYGDKTYRGELKVAVVEGRLQLVNLVGLETYLLGVVPGEMPVEWPLEALKAQAVAARTYAIANLEKGRPYDLTADARSQLYYGASAETPRTTMAVRETKAQILTFDGAPITAFYSSSSGGRTMSALDAFGADIPYLEAVADPWDSASPDHRWPPRVYGPESLAQALGISGPALDAVIAPGVEGRPAELRVTTPAGVSRWKLTQVRARLALKSSSFRIGVLRFATAAEKTRPGKPVKLMGVARDVQGVGLEQLGQGGAWAPAGARLKPAGDGSFAVTVRPSVTTTFRLTAPDVTGPSITVRVVGTTQ